VLRMPAQFWTLFMRPCGGFPFHTGSSPFGPSPVKLACTLSGANMQSLGISVMCIMHAVLSAGCVHSCLLL
jgi:hypothetical protein